jgi:predicted DNA-binding transcriptional regulator AlpA
VCAGQARFRARYRLASRAAEPLAAFVDLIADAVADRLKERRLGVTRKSLESWRSTGCAPPAVRIGRSVRFNARDPDAWARTNPQAVSPKPRATYFCRNRSLCESNSAYTRK